MTRWHEQMSRTVQGGTGSQAVHEWVTRVGHLDAWMDCSCCVAMPETALRLSSMSSRNAQRCGKSKCYDMC